jgi:hypothetical protein
MKSYEVTITPRTVAYTEPRITPDAALAALESRLARELSLVRSSLAYSKGTPATVRRAALVAAQLMAVRSAMGQW